MPLSTAHPTFGDDPRDADALLVTLGFETYRVSKMVLAEIIEGHRDFTMIPAQLANLVVAQLPTGAAVQAASAAQIQQIVDAVLAGGGAFYW